MTRRRCSSWAFWVRGMIHTGMVNQTDGSAEGWYKDPTGHHSERWFSDGTPTALVRDGHTTAQDPLSEAEAQGAACATLEFIGLPVGEPIRADGTVDKLTFEWGLAGAVDFQAQEWMRPGARKGRKRKAKRSEE